MIMVLEQFTTVILKMIHTAITIDFRSEIHIASFLHLDVYSWAATTN